MKIFYKVLFLFFAFFEAFFEISAGNAMAANCKNLSMTLQVPSYSFNSGGQVQLRIAVSTAPGPGCSFFIGFSRGGATDYNRKLFKGSSSLSYQLYPTNPFNFILEDIPQATGQNVISGSFPPGNSPTQTFSYWAVLGNTAYQAWGSYQDQVSINLYNGVLNGSYTLQQSQAMTFTYSEPKAIDLSMVASGGAFDPTQTSESLNFGTLSTGQVLGFDVVMMYNAGYALSVSSQNGGVMVLSGGASAGNSIVPYTFTANGVPVSLGQLPVQVATGGGIAPTGGTRVPIAVIIGSTTKALSGKYSDYLTLVVTSTE